MSKKNKKASKVTTTVSKDADRVPLTQVMKKATKASAKGKAAPKVTPKVAAPVTDKPARASGLNAAAQVLKDAGQPMRCKDMVTAMLDRGLWKTEGKTPAATISAAIFREIKTKKDQSRFKKTDRGLFTLNA